LLGVAAAAARGDHDHDEEAELAGRRFGAPRLAAALIAALTREAAAASAADLQLPPHACLLRPLLRSPLLAALGPKAVAGLSTSQRLGARKKPTSALWRFKRWFASELAWQARELRHALRALRRFLGRSRDPVGKTFRAVTAPDGGLVVLAEVTWRFGWVGRHGAACWRRRLRDELQLTALEAVLADELAAASGEEGGPRVEVAVVKPGKLADDAVSERVLLLALMDDSPHANLDKKLKAKRNTSVAASAEAEVGFDGRSAGVAPAVALRLEAVLAVCALKRRASDGGFLQRMSHTAGPQALTRRIVALFDEASVQVDQHV
jgi:hypothetical protein